MLESLDQFNFHHRLAQWPQPAIVAFGSPGCGACRHLKQVLEALAPQHPNWLLAEVDVQQDGALAREFDVFHLPAMFLFYRGDFHCALNAEASPAAIERAVEQALQQPAEEAP